MKFQLASEILKVRKQPKSLRKTLFRSYLFLSGIGVAMLCIALIAVSRYHQQTSQLIQIRAPSLQAAMDIRSGIQRSLAQLRGWVAVGSDEFKRERRIAWAEIQLSILRLQSLYQNDKIDDPNYVALIEILAELKETQWWIEDVAQTPGNEPAFAVFAEDIAPVAEQVFTDITGLINLEKELDAIPERKLVFWSMADFRGFFTRAWAALEIYLEHGIPIHETRFQQNLSIAHKHLNQLEAEVESLTERQRHHLRRISPQFKLFIQLTENAFDLRKSPQWNVAQSLMTERAIPLALKSDRIINSIVMNQHDKMMTTQKTVEWQSNVSIATITGLIGIMVVLSGITAHRYSKRIINPIISVLHASKDLAQGRLKHNLPVTTNDEIGHLTQSFNNMREAIQSSEEKQDESQKKLALLNKALLEANTKLTHEIAERKQSEKTIKHLNERFSIAVEAAEIGIWDWDINSQ